MSAVDELSGILKDKGFTSDFVKRLVNLDEESKKIISNDKYLKWVEKELIDDERIVSYYNYDKADNPELLYRAIDNYATRNYIYPYEDDFANYYVLKFNNKLYKVGIMSGQGVLFYVESVNDRNNYNYIDYNDLMNNKKYERTYDIDNKIAKLNFLIDTLHSCGIPVSEIRNLVGNYLDKIDGKNNDNKTRQLKR